MLKRSLPCSARRCSRGREGGMCLQAAGEPGMLRDGCCRRREGMERALRDGHGSAPVPGLGWGGQRQRRRFHTYSREVHGKKKKLVQPIAAILPWEQLEVGSSLLLPGSLHHPWGENPNQPRHFASRALPCLPTAAQRCHGSHGTQQAGESPAAPKVPAAARPDKENEAQNLCRRMHLQVPVLFKRPSLDAKAFPGSPVIHHLQVHKQSLLDTKRTAGRYFK